MIFSYFYELFFNLPMCNLHSHENNVNFSILFLIRARNPKLLLIPKKKTPQKKEKPFSCNLLIFFHYSGITFNDNLSMLVCYNGLQKDDFFLINFFENRYLGCNGIPYFYRCFKFQILG